MFSARRLLPRFGTAGTPVPYKVVVENLSNRLEQGWTLVDDLGDPRPSFEEFLSTPEPGEQSRSALVRAYGYYRWNWILARNKSATVQDRPVPALSPKGKAEVGMILSPLRRGVIRFRAVSIALTDPFGLGRRFYSYPCEQSILILPKRYPVPRLNLPGNSRYQPGGVAMASAVGESQEFVSLRDYRPGDPLRHIHWRSWAKAGKPVVKEFEDEFFVRHALVLDNFTEDDGGAVLEEAVSIAASYASEIRTQESLLDLLFVGAKAYCFTAGRGLGHTEQMLEILASIRACSSRPFAELETLVLNHSRLVSGCLCVFVSWDEARQNLVAGLLGRQVPLRVIVVVEAKESTQLDPGPMRAHSDSFHVLQVGRIEEGLRDI